MFKVKAKVKVSGVKVNVLLVVRRVVVVESKRVADLQLIAAYIHHAAVSVEHVDDRRAFHYVTVLETT